MRKSHKPRLSLTTPFPNELIDDAMPRLNDTQWRVLCVIVRQTLGWYDRQTDTRKVRDWLTQSQLKSRTGRNAQALAAAIDLLVKQGYIVVEDEAGHRLDAPRKRRACRGWCYYRLSDAWLQRVGLPVSRVDDSDLVQAQSVVFQPQMPKTEFDSSGKSNTTKEKQTKRNELTPPIQPLLGDKRYETYSEPAQEFIALFEEIGGQFLKPQACHVLSPSDVRRLEKILTCCPNLNWRLLLKSFFTDDMAYLRRHQHSLQAFIDTYHILLLKNKRFIEHK